MLITVSEGCNLDLAATVANPHDILRQAQMNESREEMISEYAPFPAPAMAV